MLRAPQVRTLPSAVAAAQYARLHEMATMFSFPFTPVGSVCSGPSEVRSAPVERPSVGNTSETGNAPAGAQVSARAGGTENTVTSALDRPSDMTAEVYLKRKRQREEMKTIVTLIN